MIGHDPPQPFSSPWSATSSYEPFRTADQSRPRVRLLAGLACVVGLACVAGGFAAGHASALADLQSGAQAAYSLDVSDAQAAYSLDVSRRVSLRSDDAPQFALPGVTPVDFQLSRGDCWLFATVSVLEDSYRRAGVAMGLLGANEYVRFSRQAYGRAMLDACKAEPNKCMFDGDAVYTGNSTTGGEVEFTAAVDATVGDAALPASVCPYMPTTQGAGEVASTDRKCDGIQAARAANPIRFKVEKMDVYFDRATIKAALRANGRALALSALMIVVPYWLPCTAATKSLYVPGGGAVFGPAAKLSADRDKTTCDAACPLSREYAGAEGCILTNRPMFTLKAEWYHRPGEHLIKEGGHAVTLVGYSDTYRTEGGLVGGYIIKNSWEDGVGSSHGARARGSHSIAYFMQQISDVDERAVCPNVFDPRSWYECPDLASCKSRPYRWFARSTQQVLRLKCHSYLPVARGVCVEGEKLYLRNMTDWGGGLSVGCFLRDSPQPAGQPPDLCTPPLLLDDLATLVSPVAEEQRPNDNDRCGYYFVPYETFEAISARYGGSWATDLQVSWSRESYAKSAAKGRDYSMVLRDTHTIKPPIHSMINSPHGPAMSMKELAAAR